MVSCRVNEYLYLAQGAYLIDTYAANTFAFDPLPYQYNFVWPLGVESLILAVLN